MTKPNSRKNIKLSTKNIMAGLKDRADRDIALSLDNAMFCMYSGFCRHRKKGQCKKCIANRKRLDREAKVRQKKEAIRRAKKITMTVGEYEDAIESAHDY